MNLKNAIRFDQSFHNWQNVPANPFFCCIVCFLTLQSIAAASKHVKKSNALFMVEDSALSSEPGEKFVALHSILQHRSQPLGLICILFTFPNKFSDIKSYIKVAKIK